MAYSYQNKEQAAAGHHKLADYFAVIGLDEELSPLDHAQKNKREGKSESMLEISFSFHLV
jgi:hypothetical protein